MNSKFGKLFKKELFTILRDRKAFVTFVIFSVALTPLLIVGVGFIQVFTSNQAAGHETVVAIQNSDLDSSFKDFVSKSDAVKLVDSTDPQKDLENKDITGYIVLSKDGSQLDAKYIYDQSSNISTASALKVNALVQGYSDILVQKVLQANNLSEKDLAPVVFSQLTLQELQNKPAQNDLVLFLLPYIILLGLIQGAAQFAIELTAGEKERNTLATTLSLNASRSTIGLAKICSVLVLSIISLVLNTSSLMFTFIVLSKVDLSSFGGVASAGASSASTLSAFSINITPAIFFEIIIVLLPLALFLSSALVLLGTFARNQKEGGLYILPLTMATIFIGLSAQAFDVNTATTLFIVPILGQVILLRQLLLGYFIPINYIVSTVTTIGLFFVILLICINMFKREEVIFRQ